MESNRAAAVEWEQRWAIPVAIATFAAIALLIGSVVAVSSLGGGGEAESLRSVHEHSATVTISSILQAFGMALLVAPLVYLFRAASARVPQMRSQFLPLVIAAPLALAVASVLNATSANQAASDFVSATPKPSVTRTEAKTKTKDCRNEQQDDDSAFEDEYGKGAGAISRCAATQVENDRAENALEETSVRSVSQGFQLGGALGLAFALVYSCLFGMRAGLLTRFWGSLGMALGVASIFGLFQFSVIWFIYFGLLSAGWLPKGRPPAWAAGEAIPWPSPGEKAAADLGEAEAPQDPEAPQLPEGDGPKAPGEPGEGKKKRKRRE